MCGIAGYSGSFDPGLLDGMSMRIRHRGPDDQGTFVDARAGIGLAHRRLSIIDLSPLGHQPMWDATGTLAIVFNGEIYNYRELSNVLKSQGHEFRGHSDTEVLLNLYLRHGVDLLERINGIFAFAIWDTRSQKLFVARDGAGVKPFYYAETGQGFAFASELKALTAIPDLDRRIDMDAVFGYLTYLWAPSPHTMLRGVRKLEPGCAMEISRGEIVRQWRFYDLPYHNPIERYSEEQAAAAVQGALATAVRRQMVADVPVGAFLSGGLDSSAVVAFARDEADRHRLQCFTIGFRGKRTTDEGFVEDLPYARAVAKHLDVDLHTVEVGPEMADYLEMMVYHLDEPQADPAPINAYLISRLAHDHGIKVLLSGAGGDDLFTGYRRHYALKQERYWSWLPGMVRGGMSRFAAALPSSNPRLRRLAKAFQYAVLDPKPRLASYFYWTSPALLGRLVAPSLRRDLDEYIRREPLVRALDSLPAGVSPLNQMLYLEGKFFLADHNLNYTDKMGMATGVEIRVPFLDKDLVDLATRLPEHMKQRGDTGKWILKKAMEPFLPADIIYRPKTGFGAPLRSWLQHQLRPLVEDLLSETSLTRRGLFDPAGVQRLLQLDRARRIDGTYTIFSLVCIELWCRLFLDNTSLSKPYQT